MNDDNKLPRGDNINYLIQYCKIVFAGFAAAMAYHYSLGVILRLGWPYNSFLFDPADRFNDFFNTLRDGYSVLNGEYNTGSTYYPFTPGYVWETLLFGSFNKWLALIIFSTMVIAFLYWFLYTGIRIISGATKRDSIIISVIIVVTSYPLYFLIDRGNQEGLQFILLAFFILCYKKEQYKISIFLLALAFCMKPFVLVFLVLFLNKNKYKYIGIFALKSIIMTYVTFRLLPGGFKNNFENMLIGYHNYNVKFVLGSCGCQFNHTMYVPLHIINNGLELISPDILVKIYFSLVVLLFFGLVIYIIKYETTLWRKVFILYLSMIGLPFISADYTLIQLYVPAILFFQSISQETSPVLDRYNLKITILLAFLMIPKEYLSGYLIAGISIAINPIIIYSLILVLCKYGLDEKRINNEEPSFIPLVIN